MDRADAATDQPARRRRNAEHTRAEILQVARLVFCERGYEGAGTREIAERAGVNSALISRYFGSKEGLFVAAIPPTMTFAPMLAGLMDDFGVRVAKVMVNKPQAEGFRPILALLRSATSPEAAPFLRDALENQCLKPLAARLSGPNALERAGLIAALIIGFDFTVKILGLSIQEDTEIQALEIRMSQVLQDLVDGRSGEIA
jgi:AcrR family transcriptional regulator